MLIQIDMQFHFPMSEQGKKEYSYHGNCIDFRASGNGWRNEVVSLNSAQVGNTKKLVKKYNELLQMAGITGTDEIKFPVGFEPSEFTQSYFRSLVICNNGNDPNVKILFEKIDSAWYVWVYRK